MSLINMIAIYMCIINMKFPFTMKPFMNLRIATRLISSFNMKIAVNIRLW